MRGRVATSQKRFCRQNVRNASHKTTGAHKGDSLAELVCSNSLKSTEPCTASGLLKKELDMLGCALLPIARECGVPSGSALSVDREKFSKAVEKELAKYPDFTLIREEVTSLDEDIPTIVASGPLTSDALAEQVGKLTGKDRLFFTMLSRLSLNLTA